MIEPSNAEDLDDDAIRNELLKMLDREEERLAAQVDMSLAKGAKEAEEHGPDAQAVWQTVEDKIRQRGRGVFTRMRDYVQRSR